MPVWHPDAKRVPYPDAGSMNSNPARGVLHTTEGYGLPRYSGSAPHFTLNPKTGELWQHIAINRCAMALKNLSGGVETNRANAVQIEMIGFAKDTDNWPRSYYREVADLMRWIERNSGVKRKSEVKFVAGSNHMSASRWNSYDCWCGHQHVPEQDHWDPGQFRIDWALELEDDPYRRLNDSEQGADVEAFQRHVNKVARNNCREDHLIEVDGVFGPQTLKHGAWALWMRGVGEDQDGIAEDGFGITEQKRLRDWDELTDAQKERARDRRKRHSNCKDED